MKTIFKYKLEIEAFQSIAMHQGAQILSVQVQNKDPYVWAMVDSMAPLEVRVFHTFVTGEPIPNAVGLNEYIGTFLLCDGEFVFHLFESNL